MKLILSFILSLIFISNDNRKATYQLISKCPVIAGCGGIALAYEFLFLNTFDSSEKIGIVLCPDGYGENYFVEDKEYNIKFSPDSIVPAPYTVANHFDTDSFYIQRLVVNEIEKIR